MKYRVVYRTATTESVVVDADDPGQAAVLASQMAHAASDAKPGAKLFSLRLLSVAEGTDAERGPVAMVFDESGTCMSLEAHLEQTRQRARQAYPDRPDAEIAYAAEMSKPFPTPPSPHAAPRAPNLDGRTL